MVYPEWVMKFKGKGRARLITDEYLGRITPDGLIEPKVR